MGLETVFIAAAFVLAGLVKGVVGFGLPTVALAVITASVGHHEAIALMLGPSLATNGWQAFAGGHLISSLRRMWPFFVAGTLGIWASSHALSVADPRLLTGLLGIALVIYSLMTLFFRPLPPPGPKERFLSPAVGALTGTITGVTGSFVVPSVMYFQCLGLSRDALIQTMGLWFFTSSVLLLAALGRESLLTADLALMSLAAIVPTIAGMLLGGRIRSALPEQRFRQVFLFATLLLGLYIAARAIFA